MSKIRDYARDMRSNVYRQLFRNPIVVQNGVKLIRDHPTISNHMYWWMGQGQYEKEEVLLVSRWINEFDSIIEVGAGVGFIASFCIKKIGVKNYCLVEANPDLIELIRRNMNINALEYEKYEIRNVVLGGEDGHVDFHIERNFWSSSVVSRGGGARKLNLPQVTIPTLSNSIAFLPNVLIMDIEGGEIAVPPEHYKQFNKIILETHARVVGEEPIAKLLRELSAMGFRAQEIVDTTYVFTR